MDGDGGNSGGGVVVRVLVDGDGEDTEQGLTPDEGKHVTVQEEKEKSAPKAGKAKRKRPTNRYAHMQHMIFVVRCMFYVCVSILLHRVVQPQRGSIPRAYSADQLVHDTCLVPSRYCRRRSNSVFDQPTIVLVHPTFEFAFRLEQALHQGRDDADAFRSTALLRGG